VPRAQRMSIRSTELRSLKPATDGVESDMKTNMHAEGEVPRISNMLDHPETLRAGMIFSQHFESTPA
jgi:hypothetical protein